MEGASKRLGTTALGIWKNGTALKRSRKGRVKVCILYPRVPSYEIDGGREGEKQESQFRTPVVVSPARRRDQQRVNRLQYSTRDWNSAVESYARD